MGQRLAPMRSTPMQYQVSEQHTLARRQGGARLRVTVSDRPWPEQPHIQLSHHAPLLDSPPTWRHRSGTEARLCPPYALDMDSAPEGPDHGRTSGLDTTTYRPRRSREVVGFRALEGRGRHRAMGSHLHHHGSDRRERGRGRDAPTRGALPLHAGSATPRESRSALLRRLSGGPKRPHCTPGTAPRQSRCRRSDRCTTTPHRPRACRQNADPRANECCGRSVERWIGHGHRLEGGRIRELAGSIFDGAGQRRRFGAARPFRNLHDLPTERLACDSKENCSCRASPVPD